MSQMLLVNISKNVSRETFICISMIFRTAGSSVQSISRN